MIIYNILFLNPGALLISRNNAANSPKYTSGKLFGFIFLMTQYFQSVRGYGPLSTGVRLLPVALSVGIGSVAGTQLAVRVGTKLVVTVGLVAMAAFYGWVAATTTATLGYGVIAVQMVLYGLGMGLTSAPATESIMGAVSRRQAGVGSAVNDSTRLLGGTLGVAVIGSVFASLYGSRLTARLPGGLPRPVTAAAHQSLGAAYAVSGRVPGALGRAVHDAATNAFIHGLSVGALVAGGVAAADFSGKLRRGDREDVFLEKLHRDAAGRGDGDQRQRRAAARHWRSTVGGPTRALVPRDRTASVLRERALGRALGGRR